MENRLHLNSVFTHSFTHRWRCQPCKEIASSSGAVRVRCLAQGHLDTRAGDRTSNLPGFRPTPEPHAAPASSSRARAGTEGLLGCRSHNDPSPCSRASAGWSRRWTASMRSRRSSAGSRRRTAGGRAAGGWTHGSRYAHSHSLTLSNSHSHTPSRSLALTLSHSHPHSHVLTFTLSHSHAHTLTLSFTLTHSCSHSHSHTLSHSHTHAHTLSHSLSLSHTHALTLSLSLSHSRTISLCLFLSVCVLALGL